MKKVLGVPNTLTALQCLSFGFDHLYLSTGQLHAFEYGYPDLNILSSEEIVQAASKIGRCQPQEFWVDIDSGECSNLKLARFIEKLIKVGVTGVQIEDQPMSKRCGHRDGKQVIPAELMVKRLISIRERCSKVKIIARTDALGLESEEQLQRRLELYESAGADIIFVEALESSEQIQKIKSYLKKPILVNRTEFGKTPHLSDESWKEADYHLLPISLARLMHKTVELALEKLSLSDCQEELISSMLTREELYRLIDYQSMENSYLSLDHE